MRQKKKPEVPTFLLDYLTDRANPETYKKYFSAHNCSEIRRLLTIHLNKRLNESVSKSDNPDKFELPSWPQVQAAECGYRRAIREILDIIDR